MKEVEMRETVWMNDPLLDLKEQLDAEGLGDGFSQRLGDIVERYQVIMKLTPAIELTDIEKMIIGESICSSVLTPEKIRRMHDYLMDCEDIGTFDERKALHDKIESVDAAGRIAIIESLGL